MALAQILTRIERVASIIETDATSPWNKERAREIQKLVQLARQEQPKAGSDDNV